MEKYYKKYSELPTIIGLFASMVAACLCLIGALFLDIREPFHSILMVTGIVLFSLSTSVFIVSLLYPWILNKKRDNKTVKDLPEL